MKKRNLIMIIAAIILLVAVSGVLAYRYKSKSTVNSTGGTYYPKATSGYAPSASSPASSATQGPAPKPLPQSSVPASSSSKVVTISSPLEGSSITSGSIVKGSVSQAVKLYFRVKGSKSGQLASGQIQASPGVYAFSLDFTNQVAGGSDTGVLEVYTLGADGNETNVASIAVEIRG